MKVWELRTERVTMIFMSVWVRRERRDNLSGERGGGQARKSPSGSNERRKTTVLFGQRTGWKSRLGISRQTVFSLNHALKKEDVEIRSL